MFAAAPDGEYFGVKCTTCRRVWRSESFVAKAYLVQHKALEALYATQEFPDDAISHRCVVQATFSDYAFAQENSDGYLWYGSGYRPAPCEPPDGIHPSVLLGAEPDRSYDREPYCPCVHDITTTEQKPDEVWTRCLRCGRVITKRLA